MDSPLLATVVVPLASEADAERTCAAAIPSLDAAERVVVVHVIEKAGGAPDKAALGQREERADRIFATATERFGAAGIDIETSLRYDTDVVDAIFGAAADVDATAIAFTPREANRLVNLLAGDTAAKLVSRADRPIVVLPDAEAADE